MSFVDAARSGLSSKYATFSGRARRSEYWWFSVVYMIGVAVIGALATAFDMPLIWAAAAGLMVPMLAVSVRRFHDRGRSGWGILINLIPVIGTIIYLAGMTRPGDPRTNRYGPPPSPRRADRVSR